MKLITKPSITFEQVATKTRKFNWRTFRFETNTTFTAGKKEWNPITIQTPLSFEHLSLGHKIDQIQIGEWIFEDLVFIGWSGEDATTGEYVWECSFEHARYAP